MEREELIAALRRMANDRTSCMPCRFHNECGVFHCELAKLAADMLEADGNGQAEP